MSQFVTRRLVPAAGAALLLSSAVLPSTARADLFRSVDHKGECYGVPEAPGATKELAAGKAYRLEAVGSEFGHHCKTDQGRFVYQEMEGDFDVSARVVELGNERHTAAKACLMVRENAEDPAARFAALMAISDLPFARRHDHGFPDSFTFDFRAQRAGNLGNEGFRYSGQALKERRKYPNVWLRLKREGDRITSFISKDGKRWTEVPPEDGWINLPSFPLGRRVAVGMCLSSEPEVKPDIRAFARFDNLRGFRTKGEATLPEAAPAGAPPAFTAPPLAPYTRPLGLGKPIPLPAETKLPAIGEGEAVSIADLRGPKGTLLVFTAGGCAAPEAAPKGLAALARAFEKKGVRAAFLAPDGAAAPAGLAGAELAGLRLLRDTDAALARALGATAAGQAFVFDRNGKLAYSGALAGTDLEGKRRAFLKDALTAVAAEKFPDVAQSPPPRCPLLATR